MVKTGDRVRFLNSVGGGIVRAFQGKNVVLVEDESGFEFPVAVSECVVAGNGDAFLHDGRLPVGESSAKPQESAPTPEKQTYVAEEMPGGEHINVFLAYLPIDPKALTLGHYESYLVNESNYYLYFNYMLRNNNSYVSRFHGLVEPNTKIFMEEFYKEELNSMERICIQMIAFKKGKPFALKNAFSVELRLDTVKFYKRHCFTENDYFDEDALIFPVVRSDVPEKTLLISATELQEAMLRKKQDDGQNQQPPAAKRKKIDNPVVEVDLHINQLLDDTRGMTASDMLNYQLDKFRETLKQYAGKKGQQIVFIHGKGEGVLRAAIEKELKTQYKSYTFQDASFQEYGFGATLVKIR
ncbi:MAG: DUF2027 domain-containing protein [Tannerella sp.]|jgi:hypothetical protein|nr:DUF2027 domain-containing protein [Tannerella sp.]